MGRRQNGNLSVIEWKYQKYIRYWELRRQNKKEKRKKEREGKQDGGSESKATVLECMIKNLKKGFAEDYGVETEKAMAPHSSTFA